jgi:hypothetical protein
MIAAQVHVFALPDGPTKVAIEDEGMSWAMCTDNDLARDSAIVLFHAQPVPLDTEWASSKCIACGERGGEEMAS